MDEFFKHNENLEILTPDGFKNFVGVSKVNKKEYLEITFTDKTKFECSLNHRILLKCNKFEYAKNLKKGDILVGKNDEKIIKNIRKINKKIDLYDIIGVDNTDFSFYSNDIISHNCAFIEGAGDLWTSAQQTLGTVKDGKAILLSTPDGCGNFFHKTWVNAEDKKNGFHTIRLPWNLRPDRDQAWRDKQTQELGDKKAAQECFDGNTRIYTKEGLKPIKFITENDYVLTHTGNYRKVVKKINNGIQETIGISTSLNRNISYVTKNHPILTKDKKWIPVKNLEHKELVIEYPPFSYCSIYLDKNLYKSCEVYNLEIDIDHSYVTEHFVVHNCDTSFLTSGETFISADVLSWYERNEKRDPIEMRRGGDMWIYAYPDRTKTYILSADTARGDGNDYSAAHILDAESLEQIAEYKGQPDTTIYGNLLVDLALEYNNALLIPERENVGWATIQQIINREYENLFYCSHDFKIMDTHRQFKTKYYSSDKKMTPGWGTNVGTRQVMLDKLASYFNSQNEFKVKIHSIRTMNELRTFVWKKGKVQAAEGYNDDLCISLAIGLWVRDTALRFKQEGLLMTQQLLNGIRVNRPETQNTPLYTSHRNSAGQDQWRMKTGMGGFRPDQTEDLTWLIR